MKFLIVGANSITEYRKKIEENAKLIEENYIKEHGHIRPNYFDMWLFLFSLIGIICSYLICSYIFIDLPFTKRLIKKGVIEDTGIKLDIIRKIILNLLFIITMGIYTVYKWIFPAYLIALGIGILIGLIFNVFNERTKRRYYDRYESKLKIINDPNNELTKFINPYMKVND